MGYATQKFSPGDLFVVKGPEDPVTGSELVITFSGWAFSMTIGICQLTGILSDLRDLHCNQGMQGGG